MAGSWSDAYASSYVENIALDVASRILEGVRDFCE
jgi:hypothetical protein